MWERGDHGASSVNARSNGRVDLSLVMAASADVRACAPPLSSSCSLSLSRAHASAHPAADPNDEIHTSNPAHSECLSDEQRSSNLIFPDGSATSARGAMLLPCSAPTLLIHASRADAFPVSLVFPQEMEAPPPQSLSLNLHSSTRVSLTSKKLHPCHSQSWRR